MKRFFKGLGLLVLTLVLIVVCVLAFQVFSFNRASGFAYSTPEPPIVSVSDSLVLARGEHLATALGGCRACHRPDLSGGLVEDLGPIGTMYAPNLTAGVGGIGSAYSDGQLARAIRHGIRNDNRSLRFMPSGEHAWWPDSDLQAIVSYVRSVPPVDNDVPPTEIGVLGKLLSQFGVFEMFSAREAAKHVGMAAVSPAPTAEYGALLALGCKGCHGEGLGGGKIPGAPASLPIPANLTMHETGLGGWSKEEFFATLNTGVRPDGRQLDPFMSTDGTRAMTEMEKTAIWEYLRQLEPREFGSR